MGGIRPPCGTLLFSWKPSNGTTTLCNRVNHQLSKASVNDFNYSYKLLIGDSGGSGFYRDRSDILV